MFIETCDSDLATMNNLVKGPPLTRQEVLLLIDLIQEHSIIMSKKTNAGSNRLKEKAWQLISEQFNAKIKSCPRRPYQLKLKWDNLKKSARRKAAIKNQADGYYIPTDDVLDTVLKLLEGTSDSGDSFSSSSLSDDRTRPNDPLEITEYEMGRKKRNCIYEFYKYDESTKTSQCLICSTILKNKHGANLMRHFQHKHKEEFKDVNNRNRQTKLLMAANSQTTSSTASKDVLKTKDTSLAVSSLPDDEAMETVSVNDDEISEAHASGDEEEVVANRVPRASDPLFTVRPASDHSTLGSDSDSDDFEVPIRSEVMKRSRVMRRTRSDVVRKNIAIAEYYEAKKMKVHLEIKKLQLEIDMRMNNRSDATNANTSNSEINIKTESM